MPTQTADRNSTARPATMRARHYCANNLVKYVDPTGMDNVIYVVDLQGDNKAVDANKLISGVNAAFKKLGLNTRMMMAPYGFDPQNMDATDSYVMLGTADAVKNFVYERDYASYDKDLRYFDGGSENPELSTNKKGHKTSAIGIDVYGLKAQAGNLNVNFMDLF